MKSATFLRCLQKLSDLSYETYLMHMIPIAALSVLFKLHEQEIRLLLTRGFLAAAGTLIGVMFGCF